MKLIRLVLGSLLLFFDRLFSPKALTRSPDEQKLVDKETSQMVLYQFEMCPFCIKVRRALRRMNLHIELKDVLKDKKDEQELIQQGGQRQVPCLRVNGGQNNESTKWIYESDDIISFLAGRFVRTD